MTLDPRLLIDAATYVHLGAVAAGLGAVIFQDSKILTRIRKPIRQSEIISITHAHRVITIALIALWITGLALIALKVGLGPWSPKLIAKFGTVLTLTGTAVLMAEFALPHMNRTMGLRLIDGTLAQLCWLSTLGAMSGAGWLTALLLGSSKILKTAGHEVIWIAVVIHVLAVACANVGAAVVYSRRG